MPVFLTTRAWGKPTSREEVPVESVFASQSFSGSWRRSHHESNLRVYIGWQIPWT